MNAKVMHRFEPRNAITKRAHSKAILMRQAANKVEELESVPMKVEGHETARSPVGAPARRRHDCHGADQHLCPGTP